MDESPPPPPVNPPLPLPHHGESPSNEIQDELIEEETEISKTKNEIRKGKKIITEEETSDKEQKTSVNILRSSSSQSRWPLIAIRARADYTTTTVAPQREEESSYIIYLEPENYELFCALRQDYANFPHLEILPPQPGPPAVQPAGPQPAVQPAGPQLAVQPAGPPAVQPAVPPSNLLKELIKRMSGLILSLTVLKWVNNGARIDIDSTYMNKWIAGGARLDLDSSCFKTWASNGSKIEHKISFDSFSDGTLGLLPKGFFRDLFRKGG